MIKGIDSQIITGRTTDVMRDASARLKGEEFRQAFQSKMQANDLQKETKTVTDVKNRELRTTDENDDGEKKKKKQKQEQERKEKEEQQGYSVVISNGATHNSNAVNGNESVGYGGVSNFDIEI
ncbi:MAG: hypothetical protein IJR47_05080 [Clostridia bacterium]|nr:hypothetical protein [Clostridia bacterium]